jgi:hypothetical protein
MTERRENRRENGDGGFDRKDFLNLVKIVGAAAVLTACSLEIDGTSQVDIDESLNDPVATEVSPREIFSADMKENESFNVSEFKLETGIELADEQIASFVVEVKGVEFSFVALPAVLDAEGNVTSEERLFFQDESWEDLFKGVNESGDLVVWQTPDWFSELGAEAVLWYPATQAGWESTETGIATFAPPKNMEGLIDGYGRDLDGGIVIPKDVFLDRAGKALNASAPVEWVGADRLRELQSRLGNVVSVKIIDGKNMLMYKSVVVGEFMSGNEIGVAVDGEVVNILDGSLELGKDSNLLSINKERTEEMGKDWVEWVWTKDGERLEVPEPVVGLPKTLEEAQVINENILDFYMPKLTAAEKAYLDENGWGSNNFFLTKPDYYIPGLPFFTRDAWVGTGSDISKTGEENLTVVGLTKVLLNDGVELLMYSVPGQVQDYDFGQYGGEKMIFHFAYNNEALYDWLDPVQGTSFYSYALEHYEPKSILDQMNQGLKFSIIRTFFSTDRDGDQGASPEDAGSPQWSYVTRFLEKMDERLDFSKIYDKEMFYPDGDMDVSREQIEGMQEIMWPVVFVKAGK